MAAVSKETVIGCRVPTGTWPFHAKFMVHSLMYWFGYAADISMQTESRFAVQIIKYMMTSPNGTILRVTGPLCGDEFPSHKCQWRGALMFSLICPWTKIWVNNREAGGLRRHPAHYNVIVMAWIQVFTLFWQCPESCISHDVLMIWTHKTGLLSFCPAIPPPPGEFPAQQPVIWSFIFIFWLKWILE